MSIVHFHINPFKGQQMLTEKKYYPAISNSKKTNEIKSDRNMDRTSPI